MDEDPEGERAFVRQPEHLPALMTLLTDTPSGDEARTAGFLSSHVAANALLTVHERMRALNDHSNNCESSSHAGESFQFSRVARAQSSDSPSQSAILDEVRGAIDRVRHGKKRTTNSPPVDFDEAKLVIVSASAWVNFIAAKAP